MTRPADGGPLQVTRAVYERLAAALPPLARTAAETLALQAPPARREGLPLRDSPNPNAPTLLTAAVVCAFARVWTRVVAS